MLVDVDGMCWMECSFASAMPGRPALFLDRDGVVVEEVNYLSRASDVRLTPGIGDAIASANRSGVSVSLVTNQSGVGRGMFGWDDFAAVQLEITARLKPFGASLDAVLACGASPAQAQPMHAVSWRKPEPGMILKVIERIDPDRSRSFIVGDRLTDLEAGRRAGLAGGWLVETGYGHEEVGKPELASMASQPDIYAVRTAANAASAIREFLHIVAG